VANCPTFKEVAADVWDFFKGCDIGGFNSNRFDIPMLVEEFLRAGINADLHHCLCIDVQNIYHKLERRTLVAAYKFYCHKDLENAHSALADTQATYEVLCAQLDHYPDVLKNDADFLAEYSKTNRNLDYAGRIVLDDNDTPVFNFGKYRGMSVSEVLRRDPGYYSWMMQGDFALNTKQVLNEIAVKGTAK
jgi:DNA polymerase-3 subunit epsilon